MKMKQNHIGIVKQSLGWLAGLAGAGLAVAALTYHALELKVERAQRDAELTEYMVRTAQVNGWLQQIGQGHVDIAREAMTSELSYDLAEVKTRSRTAEGWSRECADLVVAQATRNAKRHPDYYLASSRIGITGSETVAQVVRH